MREGTSTRISGDEITMRYIVTGGAGFIGSHIAEALASRGEEVLIIDDLSSGRKDNIAPLLDRDSVSFVEASILDLDELLESFRGADGVFHEAAFVSVPRSIEHPVHNHDVNVTGTLNVLLASRDSGVKRAVLASSAAVYGNRPELPKREDMAPDPLSPYAAAKLVDEYYARIFSLLYGVETVCLRYFNVYGPRQDPASEYAAVIPRFISRLAGGERPVIFGDGTQTRDFVFVSDVVEANLRAMGSAATGVFNIASGTETKINMLARVLMDLLGVPGAPEYQPAREGEVHRSVADISKARDAFGFTPGYPLERGLKETVDWFKRQPAPI
jgi:UDP-glucose 4-epimerase